MSATDRDREVAVSLVPDHQAWCHGEAHADCCRADDCDCGVTDSRNAVAAALAAERERARAPFLALGRRYDEEGCDSMRMGAGVYSQIAREIRAAAQDAER